MKLGLFLSSLWLLIASFFSPTNTGVLTGKVSDGTEPLIGATVKASRGAEFVRGTVTDYNGVYRIQLEPGTYDLEFSYTGYQSQKILGVRISTASTTLDVTLSNAAGLEEVEITGYKVPLIEQDKTSSGQTLTSDQIKNLPTRDVKAIESPSREASSPEPAKGKEKSSAPPPAESRKAAAKAMAPAISKPGAPVHTEDTRISGEPKPASKVEVDGRMKRVEIRYDPETYEEVINLVDDESPSPGTIAQPAPRAGLLTAGEWNDLHNWNRHWMDLLADGETDAYQTMYEFFPRQRYTVILTNENGFPIVDAPVTLLGADKILWESRTDNTGKAELWAALFSPEKTAESLRAEILVEGQTHEISVLKTASEGFNYLKIKAECRAPKNVDILWAVDATGSMGDEIEYLKTELLDVIGRAKSRNPELAYRMGAVFYRDQGDEYVTRNSAFSSDMTQTVGFIQKQFAGGGGDYPEAVHSALEEAVFTHKWSENAVARICFLVLDASPHRGAAINASLQKSIREAARLGIRIVPIAASGIQKDTEFLMKFFGLATNGSYVFLTDHSGIGGKHLEPTTDEYKVEPLNNLLVRLITEYTTVETCEGKSEIRFENDPQQQPGPVLQALYYPNPAVEQFTLELPFAVQSVTIYDSEGRAVRKLENPVEGANLILLNDLAAGFYTIRILNNGLMQSGKLMVVRT
jgi:hypothetical protein